MTLSSADLDSIRATAETALPDTVTIERVHEIPDGVGGRTQTWYPVYVDIIGITQHRVRRQVDVDVEGRRCGPNADVLTRH